MADTVTLHCEIGNHSWERPKQRGKRPKSCPEHKPQPERVLTSDGKRVLSEEHKAKMQAGRAAAKIETDKEGIQRVRDYQAWLLRDVEFRQAHSFGVISREEMKMRIGRMPVIPKKGDWVAAGLDTDLEPEAIS